jgi:hypothetical protein
VKPTQLGNVLHSPSHCDNDFSFDSEIKLPSTSTVMSKRLHGGFSLQTPKDNVSTQAGHGSNFAYDDHNQHVPSSSATSAS